jgi:hypothetical protein
MLVFILKRNSIKKKIQIAAKKMHEHLHREPYYVHPKLKFIPNIVINVISFIIALTLIVTILYLLIRFLINEFYHLK